MGGMNAVSEIELKCVQPRGATVSPAAALDHFVADWGWV